MRSAFVAIVLGLGSAQAAGNDLCADATSITGEGVFAFDSSVATTDGPAHAECVGTSPGSGEIAHDLWYCWTSTCTGLVTVDTCRQTTVDTTLAVYGGCRCPTDGTDLLACNAEPPLAESEFCGYQSRVTFTAVAGHRYLLRVGTEPGLGGGAGTFTVACGVATESPCGMAAGNCQPRDLWSAFPSNGTTRIVADDFSPRQTGDVTQLCWWGAYVDQVGDCPPPGDAFEVTYYADDGGGIPGAPMAGPFRQADGTLSVEGPVRTHGRLMDVYREYAYHAAHAPVSVDARACYWVQIVNAAQGSCVWYWEAAARSIRGVSIQDGSDGLSADGYSLDDLVDGDMAFCLDAPLGAVAGCVTPPVNDACENAIPIDEGLTLFNTTNATTGPQEQPYSGCYNPYPWDYTCCELLGDTVGHRDIWFSFTPPSDALLRIDMCDSLFDAKIGVYEHDSACGGYDSWVTCSDDACGDAMMLQPLLEMEVRSTVDYTFQVGGYQSYDDDRRGNRSDCFVEHPPEAGGGCDDAVCEAAVCAPQYPGEPWCCDTAWDDYCATLAVLMCSGHSGPGSIYLELVAPPPEAETLRSYADFLACFSGPCGTEVCEPPIYPESCRLTHDYDNDGDADLSDFETFRGAMTGP